MLFNTLKIDTAAINEGRAVPFPVTDKLTKIVPVVTVRGFTDDFIDARNAARRALSEKYEGDLVTVGTFLVALCALLARFWPRPAEGSRWMKLYTLVNNMAQNKGHTTNAADTDGKSA